MATKVLEMRGSFDKHPERKRARAREPEVREPLGDPPADLTASAVPMWQEIQSRGFWLTAADRMTVEIAVIAMLRFKLGDKPSGPLALAALSKLGFNPTDRTRIVGAAGTDDSSRDPAEAYFGK